MSDTPPQIYLKRDLEYLNEHYIDHVSAIAAELALRAEVELLKAENDDLRLKINELFMLCERCSSQRTKLIEISDSYKSQIAAMKGGA